MPKVKQYERPNLALALNIHRHMMISGKKAPDLAKALGFSRNAIYPKLRENGVSNLKIWELRAMAKTMGITLAELLEGVN